MKGSANGLSNDGTTKRVLLIMNSVFRKRNAERERITSVNRLTDEL